MKLYSDFYDYYLSGLSGCTYFAGQNELRRAAQEFFQRTKAWRITMDPATLSSESVIDLDITTEQALVEILWAKVDEKPMKLLAPGEDIYGALAIRAIDPTQAEIFPVPTAGQVLTMACALKPSNTSTGIEDFLYAQYAEAIAYGAKSRLMLEPKMPYTDVNLAGINKSMFEEAIAKTILRIARSYSSLPLRSRPSFM